jgi:predicted ATPase
MKRIVLTGGPGAGKTVISRRLVEMHPDRFVLVPEAATQVYDQLQTRWDRLSIEGRCEVQRRIYRLQIEQEERIAREHPDRVLLLDRVSVDGSAYWPRGPEDYWRDLGTTLEVELARYDLVIWLETTAALGLYDGDQSNPVRFEDSQAAIETGRLLLKAWSGHPNLRCVEAFTDVNDKIARVEEMLHSLSLAGRGSG